MAVRWCIWSCRTTLNFIRTPITTRGAFFNFSTLIATPIKYAHLRVAMVRNIFLLFLVMQETILTLSDNKNHPFYEKTIFSKIITPILHKFQPLHGVTTWLQTFAAPQKGWSETSFITPESCIALVYSKPYENIILKKDPNRNSALPLADYP